jgi:plasmid replication initiation protein
MLKDNIITKANDLNLRAYQLNRTEQLLVLSVASMIQPQDEDFKTYILHVKEFMDLLEIKDKGKYIELPKITKGLMSKVIEIKKSHSLLQVCWFSSVEHKPGEGIVEIEFSPKLKPYLLNLKDNFVSYALNQVSKLSSKYSIRIYELLKQNEFKKTVEFELNDFRYLIGLDDSMYPRYSNMKPKILLPTQKELNEKTDISFDFEEIKTGRKVTSLKFYIKSNKKVKDPKVKMAIDEIVADVETPLDTTENDIKIIMDITENKFTEQNARLFRTISNCDLKLIYKAYEYMKTMNVKSSKVGYMRTLLKNFEEPKELEKIGVDYGGFNNFKPRDYDYDKLEKQLLGWED